ncbi:MAG TPA: serine hydrolase, partial [Polyangiaceae bacterium]|nr:serine hydrolase [Polyangiaceae bacterium]
MALPRGATYLAFVRQLYLALPFVVLGCSSSAVSDRGNGGGDTDASPGSGAQDAGSPSPAVCDGKPLPPRALDHTVWRAALDTYFPTGDFRTAEPRDAGMDPTKLAAALALTEPHNSTQAIVVLRHGYIVGETYASGFTADTRHESYSMAKSFTSALVGIAIDQKLLGGIDERVCKYYPEWNCDDSSDPRSRITVEHTMNIETGLEWQEDWRVGATGP